MAHSTVHQVYSYKLQVVKEFLRKIMFFDETTFHVQGMQTNITYACGDQNALTLQCSAIETAAVIKCGVACCTII